MRVFVLLFQCRDQKGIVAALTEFIQCEGGNIIFLDQYSTSLEGGHFFLRLEFTAEEDIRERFKDLAARFEADWIFRLKSERLRMGVLVSKPDHCLVELLYRWQSGDLPVEIPYVISNHEHSKALVEHYRIPFYHFPTTKEDRREKEILELVSESSDFLVLARYMQIISKNFLKSYEKDIINIHHSFLPSFAGARPYKQAHDRGVKLIGATAHYVTEILDDGPIIEQMVARVSHRDNEQTLKRKGKNLEKLTLSQAIHDHIEHRVIRDKKRTIVFSQ